MKQEKEQLLKLIKQFPEKVRKDIVFEPYGNHPMSLNVIYFEVKNDTKLGKRLLKELSVKWNIK